MSSTPLSPLVIRALEAALSLAQDRKWDTLTLIEIATQAAIPMSDLYGITDKDTLSDVLEAWADTAMSAEAADMEDTPRERLFDTIMRRFEHLEPYRAGVLSLMRARDRSPARLTALLQARKVSARWALTCASLDTGKGAERLAKQFSTAWIIGKTERAWRQDESGDFARTMATLDGELANAEERLKGVGRFKRKLAGAKTAPTQEETSGHEAPQDQSDEA